MGSYKDWFSYSSEFNDVGYLQTIAGIIIDYYEALGCRFDHRRHSFIVSHSGHPTFYPSDGRIELSANRCSYWCKVIYQVSHELTHLFMHANNPDGSKEACWFEEIVCEAASLFFLTYFYDHWHTPFHPVKRLSSENYGYKSAVAEYVNDELADYVSDSNSVVHSLSDFSEYRELSYHDSHATSERSVHAHEVLRLYRTLTPRGLASLVRYRDYVRPGTVLLDGARYLADHNNESVRTMLSFIAKIK